MYFVYNSESLQQHVEYKVSYEVSANQQRRQGDLAYFEEQ